MPCAKFGKFLDLFGGVSCCHVCIIQANYSPASPYSLRFSIVVIEKINRAALDTPAKIMV